jgi:hypothetical protein
MDAGAEAMFSIVRSTLAAVIVLGSVSLPADAARYANGPRTHAVQSRDVSLPRGYVPHAEQPWPDRATQCFGGGM